ncbi:hypothetical protein CQW23_23504 [Capsicum baccatum]|uniref:Uncharacterized protein n=1 Tax=Capsicum baccatum TaxID=33114 RepID=A0A2G2VS40_CAPBA|nr:hypothetical protein CQW23_23504 [Capsicum baccatum]
MGRGGQSSLGYLFGDGEAPEPTTKKVSVFFKELMPLLLKGEEVIFNYNFVTESKEEYEASVWLCGSQVYCGSYLNLTGEGAILKFSTFIFRNNSNSSPGGHGSPNETDRKRLRHPYQSKTFQVKISFAAKIPMQAIANALRGQESENLKKH